MKNKPKYKLKVIDGIHKNAELVLETNTEYKVGSGDECDIILMDQGIKKEHLHLCSSEDCVWLKKNGAPVSLDGKPFKDQKIILKNFQTITMGDAHFAVGPQNEQWPFLATPVLECNQEKSDSSAFAKAQQSHKKMKFIPQKYLVQFYEIILQTNKKALIFAIGFILLFLLFSIDFVLSGTASKFNEITAAFYNKEASVNRNGLLLSLIEGMTKIHKGTMVAVGVEEPLLAIEKEAPISTDYIEVIRQVLKKKWGQKLTETTQKNGEIVFQGYNALNQNDLQLRLYKKKDGSIIATGFTYTKEQRNEIVSRLGDIVRLEVIAADDIVNLCKKIMQKRKVEKPIAHFNMQKMAVSLKGVSDNQEIIYEIEKKISELIPRVMIDNQVEFSPGSLNIVAVCCNRTAYVKLNDGSKIFPGARLENGCEVVNILQNRIQLNCNGQTTYYKIGDNI